MSWIAERTSFNESRHIKSYAVNSYVVRVFASAIFCDEKCSASLDYVVQDCTLGSRYLLILSTARVLYFYALDRTVFRGVPVCRYPLSLPQVDFTDSRIIADPTSDQFFVYSSDSTASLFTLDEDSVRCIGTVLLQLFKPSGLCMFGRFIFAICDSSDGRRVQYVEILPGREQLQATTTETCLVLPSDSQFAGSLFVHASIPRAVLCHLESDEKLFVVSVDRAAVGELLPESCVQFDALEVLQLGGERAGVIVDGYMELIVSSRGRLRLSQSTRSRDNLHLCSPSSFQPHENDRLILNTRSQPPQRIYGTRSGVEYTSYVHQSPSMLRVGQCDDPIIMIFWLHGILYCCTHSSIYAAVARGGVASLKLVHQELPQGPIPCDWEDSDVDLEGILPKRALPPRLSRTAGASQAGRVLIAGSDASGTHSEAAPAKRAVDRLDAIAFFRANNRRTGPWNCLVGMPSTSEVGISNTRRASRFSASEPLHASVKIDEGRVIVNGRTVKEFQNAVPGGVVRFNDYDYPLFSDSKAVYVLYHNGTYQPIVGIKDVTGPVAAFKSSDGRQFLAYCCFNHLMVAEITYEMLLPHMTDTLYYDWPFATTEPELLLVESHKLLVLFDYEGHNVFIDSNSRRPLSVRGLGREKIFKFNTWSFSDRGVRKTFLVTLGFFEDAVWGLYSMDRRGDEIDMQILFLGGKSAESAPMPDTLIGGNDVGILLITNFEDQVEALASFRFGSTIIEASDTGLLEHSVRNVQRLLVSDHYWVFVESNRVVIAEARMSREWLSWSLHPLIKDFRFNPDSSFFVVERKEDILFAYTDSHTLHVVQYARKQKVTCFSLSLGLYRGIAQMPSKEALKLYVDRLQGYEIYRVTPPELDTNSSAQYSVDTNLFFSIA